MGASKFWMGVGVGLCVVGVFGVAVLNWHYLACVAGGAFISTAELRNFRRNGWHIWKKGR